MGKTYQTKDVLRAVGICGNTLYDWFNRGKIPDVKKDGSKRRIYTAEDIERIKAFKNRIISPTHSS